ncbi:MAG: hypothetical protein JXM79_05735, partial [Sedimentisphaerales bacterium]|nr:hypothetical protein [Sedimentisphaerales bacterium]
VHLSIGMAFRKPRCHLDLPPTDLRKMGLVPTAVCIKTFELLIPCLRQRSQSKLKMSIDSGIMISLK